MQIVTDSAMDLSPEQAQDFQVHIIPQTFTLDGKTYRSGVDVSIDEFYHLIENTDSFPTTSQPSPGEFADVYRRVAQDDPDILSIHVSSGLSGTYNAARLGAQMVPEANITLIDSKSLSGALGWQVEAAARAINAGWDKDRIINLLGWIGDSTDLMYTLATLKYLIHGGRISHIRGLLGSILDIKPIIAVEKVGGTYVQKASVRSLKKATLMLPELVAKQLGEGVALRVQILHGDNLEGAELLRERFDSLFQCSFLPLGPIAPILGAHTGPGLVGAVYAPLSTFPELPEPLSSVNYT